jgi:hypothetical protein
LQKKKNLQNNLQVKNNYKIKCCYLTTSFGKPTFFIKAFASFAFFTKNGADW